MLLDHSSPFRHLSSSAWTGELLGDSLDCLAELLNFFDLLVQGFDREVAELAVLAQDAAVALSDSNRNNK
ncbi:hypothetical protein ACFY19_15490 [Streptosporangium saharense]|uniref:hypothetical protein n=1 Tax=Streptosporangium saharense TaxID=1706840 RepID=UPI00367D3542